MFSLASKMCFALGWWTVAAAVAYAATSGDRNGFTLLVFAGLAAAALGVAIFGFAGPDTDVRAADAGVPVASTPQETAPVAASVWPLATAGALGMLAVGAAFSRLMVPAVAVALAVAGGWLAQAWREHPSWTPEMTERINDRFVVPVGLPGTVITLAGIGAFSFSRVLLAVSKEVAVYIALGAAIAIMAGCMYVASRPRMGRAAMGSLATVSALLVLGSGIAGAVKGERQFHVAGESGEHGAEGEHGGAPEGEGDHGSADRGGEEHGADSDVVTVVADKLAFDRDQLNLPSNTEIRLVLDNRDSAPHNVALYRTEAGEVIFRGEVIEGHRKTTYRLTTPEAGIYHFQCDVHPVQMKGRVLVSAESSVEPPAGGNVTTTSTSAP